MSQAQSSNDCIKHQDAVQAQGSWQHWLLAAPALAAVASQYLSSMPLGALRTSQYVRVVPNLCASKLHNSWDDQVGLPIAGISCYNTVSVAHQIQASQAAR